LNYRDYGFEITPTAQRLAEFKSVENTYLSIFLVLGAFGLLIGTIGLAIVLQRSMLERRSEFALLAAVGFKTNSILTIVSVEYIVLLFIGLIFGTLTAVLSVYPVIQSSIETVSMGFVIRLLSIILLNGVVWIIVLAALQLKNMKLVKALRSE
jgi:putative ABC transport system permease protein